MSKKPYCTASYLDGGCSGGESRGGLGSSLLIPEISLQAPTPRAVTPCPSPSSPSPAPSPGRQSGQQISEADWDRMEALAEEERLASLEDDTDVFVVTNENKEKLLDFMQNPKVDISKSRLALELGVILEEAKRRMEEDLFQNGGSIPSKKKKKKKCKEVKFEEMSSPEEREMDVEEALKSLELSKHGNIDNLDQEGLLIEDGSLLDGFMDGFEEETENEISTAKPSVEPTTTDYFVVSGIIGIIALVGGLFILNKVVRD